MKSNEIIDPRIAAVIDALARVEDAKAEVASAIRSAAASGLSCAQIAGQVGLTRHQVEYKGFRDAWPSFDRSRRQRPAEEVPDGCVGPAEAARILGVSRTTIYTRLDAGELKRYITADGRRLVHLRSEESGEEGGKRC